MTSVLQRAVEWGLRADVGASEEEVSTNSDSAQTCAFVPAVGY